MPRAALVGRLASGRGALIAMGTRAAIAAVE